MFPCFRSGRTTRLSRSISSATAIALRVFRASITSSTSTSGAEAPQPDRGDVTALRPPVPRSRKAMERIAELYVAGAVKPPEVKLYKLSQAADAHRLSQARHFRGKLVFQVR